MLFSKPQYFKKDNSIQTFINSKNSSSKLKMKDIF